MEMWEEEREREGGERWEEREERKGVLTCCSLPLLALLRISCVPCWDYIWHSVCSCGHAAVQSIHCLRVWQYCGPNCVRLYVMCVYVCMWCVYMCVCVCVHVCVHVCVTCLWLCLLMLGMWCCFQVCFNSSVFSDLVLLGVEQSQYVLNTHTHTSLCSPLFLIPSKFHLIIIVLTPSSSSSDRSLH